jgi:AcrR family transcriptional regulator
LSRKKEIDRDRILDAAEAVILESGGRNFTLDAVAAHAGISKGGLVYSFATKDDLVHAALEREMARFREAVRRRVGGGPTAPVELVLAHIEEALDEDDASTQKAAFLVTALVHALTCWSQCDAITAYCSIRFDRKVAICMKSVTHCWLLKEFSCSEDLASSRSRRTNRNPSCSTRAILSSRCWPSVERAPPSTLLDQNDTLVTSGS